MIVLYIFGDVMVLHTTENKFSVFCEDVSVMVFTPISVWLMVTMISNVSIIYDF